MYIARVNFILVSYKTSFCVGIPIFAFEKYHLREMKIHKNYSRNSANFWQSGAKSVVWFLAFFSIEVQNTMRNLKSIIRVVIFPCLQVDSNDFCFVLNIIVEKSSVLFGNFMYHGPLKEC